MNFINRYRYHIDLFLKAFIFFYIFEFIWDFILDNECLLIENIYESLFFALGFGVIEILLIIYNLQEQGCSIKSISDLNNCTKKKVFTTLEVEDLLEMIRNRAIFSDIKLEKSDSQIKFIIEERRFPWRIGNDIFIEKSLDDNSIKLNVNLTGTNLIKDYRRVKNLYTIDKILNSNYLGIT